jgi:hypothetical protein
LPTGYAASLESTAPSCSGGRGRQYNNRHNLRADWVSDEVRTRLPLSKWLGQTSDNLAARWLLQLEGESLEEAAPHDMVVNRCMEIIDKRFLFVGITELFCESLFVYSVLIGAERPPLWRHLGRSFAPCPSDLSQSILEQLEYKTRIDAAIW